MIARSGRLALLFVLAAHAPASAATIAVTSPGDEGAGTLRDAIERANREPGSSIRFQLGSRAVIEVTRALPPLGADGTTLDGGGATLREGQDCRRERGERGCDGIVVRASDVTVRNLKVAGFTFDGIGVRGSRARRVHIEGVEAIDNLDDGVGVSDGASEVEVRGCLLMGNGFRTKGKGLLVFDGADAALRDSTVVANRDGVTVSRDSRAVLDRVLVAASFDKGIGVSGGSVDATRVQVLANGRDAEIEEAAPNADGLRVGLGGRADVRDSRIAGNGDSGVVVLDRSEVTLQRCDVSANRGRDTRTAPEARLTHK